MAYFSNGSEGEILDRQCRLCLGWDSACPIALVQMLYNYDQVDKGREKLRDAMSLLIDDDGVCQMKKQLDERKMLVGETPLFKEDTQ